MTSAKIQNNIGIVELNHPPLNSLSLNVRQGILSSISSFEKNSSIQAIIIIGNEKTFSAGADISEFQSLKVFKKPLPFVFDEVEKCTKPIIAAIHGTALGGGFELALGCHQRVSLSTAKLGLPEVKLGIVPGAGATQRLPRLIGSQLASEMICTGDTIDAATAQSRFILDKVFNITSKPSFQSDKQFLLTKAIEYASKIAEKDNLQSILSNRRISSLNGASKASLHQFFQKQLEERVKKNSRGMIAPLKAIEAIKAASQMDYKAGMKIEQRLISELIRSSQSRALQHIFFAERSTRKIPETFLRKNLDDYGKVDVKEMKIRKVGVIGAGLMGTGITICFLNAGVDVVLLDTKPEFLERGKQQIQKLYKERVSKKKSTLYLTQQAMKRLTTTLDYQNLSDVQIVIEAVFENLELKRSVMKRLDRVCSPSTILCTNTSTLDIDRIAAATSRPDKVIGTHFFSPANVMKLLENVIGKKTSQETISVAMNLAKLIKKVPVLVGNCFGFVANRMLFQYTNQAFALVQEGCLPHQIDNVLVKFGFPMGPFQMFDLAGNDVGQHIRRAKRLADKENKGKIQVKERYVATIADKLYELGRLGLKSGRGWYKYNQGSRLPIPDTEINELIIKTSISEGFRRREISDREILERCLFSMVNEGFKCLEESIASKAGDIDIIWVYGFGFPPYKGGPMHQAENLDDSTIIGQKNEQSNKSNRSEKGLEYVLNRIIYYGNNIHQMSVWKPSNLLVEKVKAMKEKFYRRSNL